MTSDRKLPLYVWALVLFAITALPLFVASVPPLTDYPNHLVRFWLLAGGAKIPAISQYLFVDWMHTSTNDLVDVLATALQLVLPTKIVGSVLLLASAFMPPAGAALLSATIYGRWTGWHAVIFVLAWTSTLLTGLLSFEFSLGLALVATWMDYRDHHLRPIYFFGRRLLFAGIIWVAHPFGFLTYASLVFGMEIGPRLPNLSTLFSKSFLIEKAKSLLPFAIILVIIATGHLLGNQGQLEHSHSLLVWQPINPKAILLRLIEPIRDYRLKLDCIIALGLFIIIGWCAWKRALYIHSGLSLVALGYIVSAFLAPDQIGTTTMLDVRFMSIAFLIGAVSLLPDPKFLTPSKKAVYLAVCITLVLAKAGTITQVWKAREPDMTATLDCIRSMPVASRLLVVDAGGDGVDDWPSGRTIIWRPTYRHFGTLAMMERSAFVPTLFAESGKQPITYRQKYQHLAVSNGGVLPKVDQWLRRDADYPYLKDWNSNFDYVLVLNAQRLTPFPSPEQTHLVKDNGFAKLFEVLHN